MLIEHIEDFHAGEKAAASLSSELSVEIFPGDKIVLPGQRGPAMPIPTQTDMFGIVLSYLDDGLTRSRPETVELVKNNLGLTPEECSYKTSSGKPVYESRINWSLSYLARAQLIDRVSRGYYRINDEGKAAVAKGASGSDFFAELRRLIEERDPWNKGSRTSKSDEHTDESQLSSAKSPQEQISDLAEEMNETIGDELMALIMERDPSFFEKVVVNLLEHMGYGKGEVTSRSNDGGIDGLITTDVLGFRPVYTQAKRYAADHKVGRPAIQSFIGALNGQKDGVFITTSSFTDDAIQCASNYPGGTIALVDGRKLTDLMIRYGLGVTTEDTVEIKRIDTDYFEDE